MKISVLGSTLLPYELLTPKPMQTNPMTVGCPQELCNYTWLPETVHALTVGHREINLKLSWLFPPSLS